MRIDKKNDLVVIIACICMVVLTLPLTSSLKYIKEISYQILLVFNALALVHVIIYAKFYQIYYDEDKLNNTYLADFVPKKIVITYDNISKLTFVSTPIKKIFTSIGSEFCLIIFEKGKDKLYYPTSFHDGQIVVGIEKFKWQSIIDFLTLLADKRPDLKESANNVIAEICRIHNAENKYSIIHTPSTPDLGQNDKGGN